MAGFFILMLSFSADAAPAKKVKKSLPAQTNTAQPHNKEARERMRNRAKLLALSKKRLAVVPPTPAQKSEQALRKLALRAQNRQHLAIHGRWHSGRISSSGMLLALPTEELMAELSSSRVESTIHQVILKLKAQIGKPYVWGGQTPGEGFDCSGLVYFAYNELLSRKLPRTANGMYQDRGLKPVPQEALRRGDLVFFQIKSQNKADHVGVYLGGGQFIEAPRTGLTIRVSQLEDSYWQARYLGAKRIITKETIL